jgi:hypothetical protein
MSPDGPRDPSGLPPQVVKTLLAMQPGQVTSVIQIENAFTIIRLNAHTACFPLIDIGPPLRSVPILVLQEKAVNGISGGTLNGRQTAPDGTDHPEAESNPRQLFLALAAGRHSTISASLKVWSLALARW